MSDILDEMDAALDFILDQVITSGKCATCHNKIELDETFIDGRVPNCGKCTPQCFNRCGNQATFYKKVFVYSPVHMQESVLIPNFCGVCIKLPRGKNWRQKFSTSLQK